MPLRSRLPLGLTAALLLLRLSLGAVIELTPSTLDAHMSTTRPTIIEFYASWCRHCQLFAPIYAQLSEQHPQIVFTRIDAHVYRLAGLRFSVRGYPSFYLVHSNRVFLFTAARTAHNLVTFAQTLGRTNGEEITRVAGPLSVYWKAVFAASKAVDALVSVVHSYTSRGGSLVLLAACVAIGVLSAFVLIIHVVTQPPKTHTA